MTITELTSRHSNLISNCRDEEFEGRTNYIETFSDPYSYDYCKVVAIAFHLDEDATPPKENSKFKSIGVVHHPNGRGISYYFEMV